MTTSHSVVLTCEAYALDERSTFSFALYARPISAIEAGGTYEVTEPSRDLPFLPGDRVHARLCCGNKLHVTGIDRLQPHLYFLAWPHTEVILPDMDYFADELSVDGFVCDYDDSGVLFGGHAMNRWPNFDFLHSHFHYTVLSPRERARAIKTSICLDLDLDSAA